MMVKDFNHHKSNGGITQQMTIDTIKTFKCSKKGTRSYQKQQLSQRVVQVPKTAKCVVSATQHTCTKTVQYLAKNTTNVVLKIILILAVDQLKATAKTKATREVEHQLVAGAQRDITDPAEVDAPGQGHI